MTADRTICLTNVLSNSLYVHMRILRILSLILLISAVGCAHAGGGGGDTFRDQNMDFGSLQSVVVMPFMNVSKDQLAGDRVRDVFVIRLLATGGLYVVPTGEVMKAINAIGISNPGAPTNEEMAKLGTALKVQGVFTGMVREYGEIRSGSSVANAISLSLQLSEAQTGRIVWSASSTKGGIGMKDRLLGGGGDPMNDITVKAVNDLIDKLYQ